MLLFRARRYGFTLVELLISIAIALVLVTISIQSFKNFNDREALTKDTALVVSVLHQARAQTLASQNNDPFGVHFTSSALTLFEGATYDGSASANVTTSLNTRVQVGTALSGGGVDLVFQQVTGATAQSGVITLSLIASPTQTRHVTIYATGLSETD